MREMLLGTEATTLGTESDPVATDDEAAAD